MVDIALDRTFSDLAISDKDGDEAKMVRLSVREGSTRRAKLLAEPRVMKVLTTGAKMETPRKLSPLDPG